MSSTESEAFDGHDSSKDPDYVAETVSDSPNVKRSQRAKQREKQKLARKQVCNELKAKEKKKRVRQSHCSQSSNNNEPDSNDTHDPGTLGDASDFEDTNTDQGCRVKRRRKKNIHCLGPLDS